MPGIPNYKQLPYNATMDTDTLHSILKSISKGIYQIRYKSQIMIIGLDDAVKPQVNKE